MNSRHAQKRRERAHLNIFLECRPEIVSQEPIASERPDFLLQLADALVGIEITEVFVPAAKRELPRQAHENNAKRVVDLAREEYKDRMPPNIGVSVFYAPEHRVKKNAVRKLADWVVARVGEHLENNNEETNITRNGSNEPWPPEIDWISVQRLPKLTASFWGAPDGSIVPDLTKNQLVAAIEKKHTQIDEYGKRCDELWLVVVIDQGKISSTLLVPDELFETPYDFDFDRVFLLVFRDRRVFEIPRS